MKILLIGNPIASGGNAGERIKRLSVILEDRGHAVESYLTRFAGDGKAFISRLNPGFDRIVVVGGDGTFNEILNGIPDNFSVPLAQLPTGNANLLGKDLSLPTSVFGTADLLENGQVLMADWATMNGLKFIMAAGAGFDARVTEELKKGRTGKVSNLSYILPVVRALRTSPKARFSVAVDDKYRAEGAAVLVCNVKTYAGICEIAFDAGVDSAQLDIIVLPKEGLVPLCMYFAAAKFGRITRLKNVQYLQGKKIKITADAPIPMELDGDFVGRYPQVTIELKPNRLPIVAPQQYTPVK